MDRIRNVLLERLASKGMEVSNIPAYMRDVANSITANGYFSLRDVNKRLNLLGWQNFKLDDHTLQLIIAYLEIDSINSTKQDE